MTAFEYISPRSSTGLLGLSAVGRVATSLARGGLAILPTETGYMLAARATSTEAVLKMFRVKDRHPDNVVHVACSSMEMIYRVAAIDSRAQRILDELTPGPITVVTRATALLPSSLVTLHATVGIRVPDHPGTLQVISAVGEPLTATSLNRAGEAAILPTEDRLERLNWPPGETVFVVHDDESITYDRPSTLIRLVGSELEVLRPGPVSEEVARRVASEPTTVRLADGRDPT